MSLSLPLDGRAMVAEGRGAGDSGLWRGLVRLVGYGCDCGAAVRVERRAGGMVVEVDYMTCL